MPDHSQSLYERLGGAAAVSAAVDRFYERVLQDERLTRFFAGFEPAQLVAKQRMFLTFAFGGPAPGRRFDLRATHAPLVRVGLGDEHFDLVVEHLGATLTELGVTGAEIQESAQIAASVRDAVLGRDAQDKRSA